MSDAPTPMAPPVPAPVLRLKVLTFILAGLAFLTMLLGLGRGFGRAQMAPIALGLIGPVLCVVLAFPVQAHKNWARFWIAVVAMLAALGDGREFSSLWNRWWGRFLQLSPHLQIDIAADFVIMLLSAVLLVFIIVEACDPRTIAWCQPLAARALADKSAQPLAQQYPALEYPSPEYPSSGAVPPQAAARQHIEPQFGDVPSQLPVAPAQVPEAVSDHVASGESAAGPVSSPSVPDSEFLSSRWAPPEPGIVAAREPVTAAVPTPEPVLPTPPSQGRRHS